MEIQTLFLAMKALGIGLATLIGGVTVYERDLVKYSYERSQETGAHTQEFPIVIPQELPSMQAIAQEIAKYVDPAQFMFGGSTSEHQCSKKCTPKICTHSRFIEEQNAQRSDEDRMAQPTDARYKMNWYDNYKNYIDDAVRGMYLRDLRFSIEWALVQPEGPESWDEAVLDHYADLFITCLKKKVRPLVCLHHYTDPNWFFHEKKGFTKIENVQYFVDYCTKVYEHIMKKVAANKDALNALQRMGARQPMWATFNAPAGYVFRVHRQEPLDKKLTGLGLIAEAIKNTCEATVQVSKSLKARFADMSFPVAIQMPQVGFLKNGLQVDAQPSRVSALSRTFANLGDQMRHEAIYNFFTTGVFNARHVYHENKDAVGSIDFVGLNYYANKKLHLLNTVPATTDEKRLTDGGYHSYPEGMYRAIVELHEKMIKPIEETTSKELPMFVAENGIATMNDAQRARFYHEHLYVIMKANQDGYKVRGYLPWTLFDNYEWPALKNNTERNYGIFAVTNDGKHLTLKPGSDILNIFGTALRAIR